jgi:hypothetical protein
MLLHLKHRTLNLPHKIPKIHFQPLHPLRNLPLPLPNLPHKQTNLLNLKIHLFESNLRLICQLIHIFI